MTIQQLNSYTIQKLYFYTNYIMRFLVLSVVLLSIFSVSSCRKDFNTVSNFGKLTFSKDTVFLDTVFTNISSSTYNLKVYNKSNKAITIPSIRLKNGISSNYRLNIDGVPGKLFQDIDILANDSIYVFIETTINLSDITNPLYVDKILFDTGNKQQNVNLVTLVQDAVFIYPDRNPINMEIDSLILDGKRATKGRFLEENELTFKNTKPYVIYGYAAVPENKILTIEAGTKIHFHDNSGLIVDKNASLKVNGTLENKVVFESDRLEFEYSDVPGQWGAIWMRAGSKDNIINHAIIKNGIIGILIDSIGGSNTPTLHIKNSEVYNNSAYGILGIGTNIKAENIVIGNSGQSSLACIIGGTYNFTHCTFTNYWNNSPRKLPTVLVNNFTKYKDENEQEITEVRDLYAANFINCIIGGNNNREFIVEKVDEVLFNFNVKNSMIQFSDPDSLFADNEELKFDNINHYQKIILNGKTDFKDSSSNEFIIGEENEGVNKAKETSVTLDILEKNRTTAPDIGAYQHIIFEEKTKSEK